MYNCCWLWIIDFIWKYVQISCRHSREQRREVCNILKELKVQVKTKTTRLNINAENIWSNALKGFRQRNFSPTNTIEVNFSNCKNRSNTSAASKHHFFQLLMLHLQNSSLFEGSSGKNLALDFQGNWLLCSKTYWEVCNWKYFLIFSQYECQFTSVVLKDKNWGLIFLFFQFWRGMVCGFVI